MPAPAPPEAWTLDDLANLPEDGRRYEIVDGGLYVSPAPGLPHQFVLHRLCVALDKALPPDLAIVPGIDIHLGRSMLIPDVSVVVKDAVAGATLARPADVRLVVEIVSPSSVGMDRVLKPVRYAEAGIPSYWRVEPGRKDTEMTIAVYELDGDKYRETVVIEAGEQVEVDRPFRVTLAPAQLIP
jgi:Uma2 family endonuclease